MKAKENPAMNFKSLLSTLIVATVLAAAPCAQAVNLPLPRSTPEAQGISSEAIRNFISTADTINLVYFCGAGAFSVERGVSLEKAQEQIQNEYHLVSLIQSNNHWKRLG